MLTPETPVPIGCANLVRAAFGPCLRLGAVAQTKGTWIMSPVVLTKHNSFGSNWSGEHYNGGVSPTQVDEERRTDDSGKS